MSFDDATTARAALARTVIAEAGRLAMAHFRDLAHLEIRHKLNGQDVVSVADQAVEALIRSRLAEAFPEDGILGEEEGLTEGHSGFVWVVDPIDGTSCFVRGLSDWCVSIALLHENDILLGLIDHPVDGELFVAERGKGAFLNDRAISVDREANITNGLVGLGANFRVPPETVTDFALGLLRAGGMFVRTGSGALMLAHVACGRLAAYYEPHINAWDCMAGICLIREAGGWVAEFPGSDGLLAGGPVVAAAPQLRADLITLIAQSRATP